LFTDRFGVLAPDGADVFGVADGQRGDVVDLSGGVFVEDVFGRAGDAVL
jgi:hypothetical protein